MADEATGTTATTETAATAAETSGDKATETAATAKTGTETKAEPTEGTEALGDAGKKALDLMKAERKAARDEATTAKAERDALQAKLDGKEAEHEAAKAAQKVRDEALGAANERILKAEVRAAAAGKLADPQDALRFLNLADFEVGSDGEVDTSQIAKAIDTLIESKSYLAAQGGSRFQGSGDGGARNESTPSIDDQIAEATKAGNHQLAIALKQRRSAELAKKS